MTRSMLTALAFAFPTLVPLQATASAQVKTGPSVAVFALMPKSGFNREMADVLGDVIVQEVRNSRVFSRAISSKELETLIGFEQQKQLMNCSETGCLAEISGQLGVDLVLTGNIGRVGRLAVINLQLLEVKRGASVASVSKTVCADREELILQALRPAVQQMLLDAQFTTRVEVALSSISEQCGDDPTMTPGTSGIPARVAAPAGQPLPAATQHPDSASSARVPQEGGGIHVGRVAMGGVSIAASLASVVTSLALVLGAMGTLAVGVTNVVYSPVSLPLTGSAWVNSHAIFGVIAGGLSLGALLALLATVGLGLIGTLGVSAGLFLG